MLRYAHLRAVELGIDVDFRQRLAEDTRFPAGHFDLVQSVILFHEVPFAVTQRIVREVFRVLRPGGRFNIFDFPAGEPIPAAMQYFLDIDHQYNGEPWSLQFIYADLTRELQSAGFEVERGPLVQRYLRTWYCRKPG
jgi:SAM-dependent methyltransferase